MRIVMLCMIIFALVLGACSSSGTSSSSATSPSGENNSEDEIPPAPNNQRNENVNQPAEGIAMDPWDIPAREEALDIDTQGQFIIETWRDLEYLSENLANNEENPPTYVVTDDITFPTIENDQLNEPYVRNGGFTPIGNAEAPFTGSFFGNNHVINNLKITGSDDDGLGLFGVVDIITIENLRLHNSDIEGAGPLGTLIGRSNEQIRISNVSVTESKIRGHSRIGGLIGYMNRSNVSSHIISSTFSGEISGNALVGGLVGLSEVNSRIRESGVTINIRERDQQAAPFESIGGLIGKLDGNNNTIINAYAKIEMNLPQNIVGGLIGIFEGTNNSIQSSYVSGSITGRNNVGGLIGIFRGSNNSIEDSYASGTINGGSAVGGLVGLFVGAGPNTPQNSILRSYTNVEVSGDLNILSIGALIGQINDGNTNIRNVYWNGQRAAQSIGINDIRNNGQIVETSAIDNISTDEFSDFTSTTNNGPWILTPGEWPQLSWQVEQ